MRKRIGIIRLMKVWTYEKRMTVQRRTLHQTYRVNQ